MIIIFGPTIFYILLNNNSLDQPEQVNDTECSIMKAYMVIHNERVQGDHYFWNNVFGPNSFFNIELIGPTLTTEGYRGIHNEKVQGDP